MTANGLHTLEFRVANNAAGAAFHAEIDSVRVTPQLVVPNTGGTDAFTTLAVPDVALPAGPHLLRLAMDTAGANGSVGAYNFITIRPASQSTGTFALAPAETVVPPGERALLSLSWTVPTTSWHDLKEVDLRLVDDQGVALWIRFDEASRTVSLFNPHSGKFGPAKPIGSAAVLSNSFATIHLATSKVVARGPNDPTVVLTLDITFKEVARGRRLRVEAAASDDFEHVQPFELAGFLVVEGEKKDRRGH